MLDRSPHTASPHHGTALAEVAPVTANVAVVGVGYWGRNLVRNFHQLGALACLCDAHGDIEQIRRPEYGDVRFCRDFAEVLDDPAIAAVALATPAVTHY